MAELTELTLAQVQAGLRQGAFSAVELVEAYIAAIERARVLNAYIADTFEAARAMAAESRRSGCGRARRGRSKASRSASRTCSARRAFTPRPAATSSTASGRPMN